MLILHLPGSQVMPNVRHPRRGSSLSSLSVMVLIIGSSWGFNTPVWADSAAPLTGACAGGSWVQPTHPAACLPTLPAVESAAAWAAGSEADPHLDARPSLSLKEALLGTWSVDNGRRLYYFAPDQVTIVIQIGQSAQPITQVLPYEVLDVDEATGMLRLKIETPLNWAEVRTLRFAPDRQGVLEQLSIVGQNLSSEWTYAGQAQMP